MLRKMTKQQMTNSEEYKRRKKQCQAYWKSPAGKEASMRSYRKRYARFCAFLATKKDKPCVDCNIKYPPCVMDFDHMQGKDFSVGLGSSLAKWRVEAEIEKCELVCANCHRLRTEKRRRKMFSNSHLATQNKEAVLREYTHAIQDLADRKALNIRTANPDLAVDFDRIDANAKPSG